MDDKTLPTKQEDDFFTILGNTFKLINKSWEALLLNLGTFILVYVLPFIIFFAALFLFSGALIATNGNTSVTAVTIALGIAAGIGLLILLVLVSIASIIAQLASVRGQKISFKEVVDQSQPFFWRFIGLGIVSTLIVVAGFILLIIPGFIALFLLLFSGYAMIDKNLGIMDAVKTSVDLTKKNWKIVLAFILLQTIIGIPQVIPFFGAIVTTILSIAYFCLPAILYLRIAKGSQKKVSAPVKATT